MPSHFISAAGDLSYQNVLTADPNLSTSNEHSLERENEEDNEDEEEDVDFNPFLKETPSLEASSSLSSENEGLDTDVGESGDKTFIALARNPSLRPVAIGYSEHGEEIVMQTTVSSVEGSQKGVKRACFSSLEEGKVDIIPQSKNDTLSEKENCSSSRADVVNDFVGGEFNNVSYSRKTGVDVNNDDSICMRTRARYSLASFTLDELETFLQETDDDDDIQNVNDEEEYRKFLAAVLQGREYDDLNAQENENVDDEEEDNDADFELELEEALESDLDENERDEVQEHMHKAVGWRSKVRQSRQLNASAHTKKKLSGQLNRPLRPLLPNAPVASFASLDGKILMPGKAIQCPPSSANSGFVCRFTPQQIGQLHCLIHEHVQLLIQVFSLCVFDPSRQQITSDVQVLLLEILGKRDQALTWRSVPHPNFCFCPPHVFPSVPAKLPNILPAQTPYEPSSASDGQSGCFLRNNVVPPPSVISPAKGQDEYKSSEPLGDLQAEVSCWLPCITGAIFSVVDVAPLKLVRCYMDDVSTAVREKRQLYLEVTSDSRFEKEPLFPLHNFQFLSEANGPLLRGTITPTSSAALSASASNEMPRKTLAAALVEKAMKQSVAPVPKEIAKLAQRFIRLFNPALYPHKAPPAPVANRVLFTEAEDELLAMGLMEYNTDWKGIQQRFLPCKSKHQIFVRQKNRSSSKAPENPIKAVRRMKNSPLTAEEKARIEEGLKIFKLDWMSVWKFIVPYRDPSLLPRQWRIATGTQKSYKLDADKKERRRMYEAKRRKCKPMALPSWHTPSEKEDYSSDNAAGENNSTDDCMDKEDEAYVHEAFLADWRPSTCDVSSTQAVTDLGQKAPPTYSVLQEGSNVGEQVNSRGDEDSQPQTSYEFPVNLRSSKSQFPLRPYRSRKSNNPRLVKLAPDLPPVNLPPSVRVISQSVFENYVGEASTKFSGVGGATAGPSKDGIGAQFRFVSNPLKAGQIRSNFINNGTTNLCQEGSGVRGDKFAANEKDGLDLQMHPLLFHAPDDGRLPYHSANCSTSSLSSFNFFSGNQPHLNLSLLHNPHKSSYTINCFDKSFKSKETTSSAFGIDFHPLMQRTNNEKYDFIPASSADQISASMEPSSGKGAQLRNSFEANLAKSDIKNCPVNTKSSSPNGKRSELDPNGKRSELDLEMHLSFVSRREKGTERKDVSEHNTTGEVVSCPGSVIPESQNAKNSLHCGKHIISASTPDGNNMKLDSGGHAVVVSCNETNKNSINNINDQSLPEIVMEQEELSDSEEEIDENVEFECEEMADSEEEEGSDADHQTKEVSDDANKMEGLDFSGSQYEQISHGTTGSNTYGAPEGLALNKEKDNAHVFWRFSRGSDSQPMKSNQHKRCSVSMKQVPRSSRCRNTVPNVNPTAMQRDAEDMLHQPNLGPFAEKLVKPRKGPCGAGSSLAQARSADLNSEITIEGSGPVGNGRIT